jgi:hypothetical protein
MPLVVSPGPQPCEVPKSPLYLAAVAAEAPLKHVDRLTLDEPDNLVGLIYEGASKYAFKRPSLTAHEPVDRLPAARECPVHACWYGEQDSSRCSFEECHFGRSAVVSADGRLVYRSPHAAGAPGSSNCEKELLNRYVRRQVRNPHGTVLVLRDVDWYVAARV